MSLLILIFTNIICYYLTLFPLSCCPPGKVQCAVPFTESFPVCSSASALPSGDVHQQYHSIMEELANILNGYGLPEPFFDERLGVLTVRHL